MFTEKLNRLTDQKNSLLCVGLDADIEQIPRHLLNEKDPLLAFNREIIHATSQYAVAYKPNIAFYESLGADGWLLLEKTLQMIPPDTLVIADAKRSDIGNSAHKYAETFFQTFSFDAVTVSPYMGTDSILPFLEYQDRGVFILCLTSNSGSGDFQYLVANSEPLYLKVAGWAAGLNLEYGNVGLVVGATHPEDMSSLRDTAYGMPFLIPGIGAQGGNLQSAVLFGTDEKGKNVLISASRSIIYASGQTDFARQAGLAAKKLRDDINRIRDQKTKP